MVRRQKKIVSPQLAKYEILAKIFPRALAIEIVLFEGTVVEDFLRQYICEVYSSIFKSYFGCDHSLKMICGCNVPGRRPMRSLQFYSAWSTLIRVKHPHFVKTRKSRKYMAPYNGLIPFARLDAIRKKLEKEARAACFRTRVTTQLLNVD
jgi:hypothetical protein